MSSDILSTAEEERARRLARLFWDNNSFVRSFPSGPIEVEIVLEDPTLVRILIQAGKFPARDSAQLIVKKTDLISKEAVHNYVVQRAETVNWARRACENLQILLL